MARSTAEDTEIIKGVNSSRFVTGTTAMTGDCVATTEAAVEQTGHICEADGEAVKSAQKWNCAPRKITPRSSAKMRICRALACMCLLRQSLGWNGCRVKQSNLVPEQPGCNQPAHSTVQSVKLKCRLWTGEYAYSGERLCAARWL